MTAGMLDNATVNATWDATSRALAYIQLRDEGTCYCPTGIYTEIGHPHSVFLSDSGRSDNKRLMGRTPVSDLHSLAEASDGVF